MKDIQPPMRFGFVNFQNSPQRLKYSQSINKSKKYRKIGVQTNDLYYQYFEDVFLDDNRRNKTIFNDIEFEEKLELYLERVKSPSIKKLILKSYFLFWKKICQDHANKKEIGDDHTMKLSNESISHNYDELMRISREIREKIGENNSQISSLMCGSPVLNKYLAKSDI